MLKNQDTIPSHKKVLVVGGGLGGIRAAMDLAESGRDVVLIDKSTSIGGLMTQLDRTFPTNNCDLCTISPRLSGCPVTRHTGSRLFFRVFYHLKVGPVLPGWDPRRT